MSQKRRRSGTEHCFAKGGGWSRYTWVPVEHTQKNPNFIMLRTLWCVYRICLICYFSSLLCKVEILVGYYVCIRLTFLPVMAVGYFWDGCLHSLILESLQVSLED